MTSFTLDLSATPKECEVVGVSAEIRTYTRDGDPDLREFGYGDFTSLTLRVGHNRVVLYVPNEKQSERMVSALEAAIRDWRARGAASLRSAV